MTQCYSHKPHVVQYFKQDVDLFQKSIGKEPINDRPLTGRLKGLHVFSIGGDIRVVYQETNSYYLLLDIGTHNRVY
jgi:mRNA-degrading endonuclease YafQ of YafQ-DinJ toxin-antitoxin module